MGEDRIDDHERARLLDLARRALVARVNGQPPPDPPAAVAGESSRGAFVSIHRGGELRGCLGRLEPRPLSETILHLAAIVADSDPRFGRVRPTELDDIHLEISVLTPEQEITSIADIEVGRHGLVVEQGHCRGLLLPQVPVEHHWDRTTFLDRTCLKAGLRPDAWKHGARLLVFEAEVFGD